MKLKRQIHAHEYLGNKDRITITDILDQFTSNSWNLICKKMPRLELPVSIGKVCGFLNEKKLNDGFRKLVVQSPLI